jgi:hypothetical protein
LMKAQPACGCSYCSMGKSKALRSQSKCLGHDFRQTRAPMACERSPRSVSVAAAITILLWVRPAREKRHTTESLFLSSSDVRFVPEVDINDMSGCAATASECGVSLGACILWRWRHSTGWHYRSPYCLPKYCLCGSSLRTRDTGSPNIYCLGRTRSPRTRVPRRRPPVVDRRLAIQGRWQKSCGSSSTSVLDAQ